MEVGMLIINKQLGIFLELSLFVCEMCIRLVPSFYGLVYDSWTKLSIFYIREIDFM